MCAPGMDWTDMILPPIPPGRPSSTKRTFAPSRPSPVRLIRGELTYGPCEGRDSSTLLAFEALFQSIRALAVCRFEPCLVASVQTKSPQFSMSLGTAVKSAYRPSWPVQHGESACFYRFARVPPSRAEDSSSLGLGPTPAPEPYPRVLRSRGEPSGVSAHVSHRKCGLAGSPPGIREPGCRARPASWSGFCDGFPFAHRSGRRFDAQTKTSSLPGLYLHPPGIAWWVIATPSWSAAPPPCRRSLP
jgi:hypothetical protein